MLLIIDNGHYDSCLLLAFVFVVWMHDPEAESRQRNNVRPTDVEQQQGFDSEKVCVKLNQQRIWDAGVASTHISNLPYVENVLSRAPPSSTVDIFLTHFQKPQNNNNKQQTSTTNNKTKQLT